MAFFPKVKKTESSYDITTTKALYVNKIVIFVKERHQDMMKNWNVPWNEQRELLIKNLIRQFWIHDGVLVNFNINFLWYFVFTYISFFIAFPQVVGIVFHFIPMCGCVILYREMVYFFSLCIVINPFKQSVRAFEILCFNIVTLNLLTDSGLSFSF